MLIKPPKLQYAVFTAAFAAFASYGISNVSHADSNVFAAETQVSSAVSPALEESPMTGQFLHTPTQGIRYSTDTQVGTTDSNGHFQYLENEVVSFYIGDLKLGDAAGNSIVSIFDLVEGADVFTGNAVRQAIDRSTPFNRAINIATLLQTLDRDNNPDNGVALPFPVTQLFSADAINFDQQWDEFRSDLGLRGALTEGKNSGLLKKSLQILQPSRVLRQVYQGLGVDIQLRPDARILKSSIDGIEETVMEYDSEGRLLVEDILMDGEQTIHNYYGGFDANGNLTVEGGVIYIAGDPNSTPIPVVTNSRFDRHGNLVEMAIGEPSANDPEQIESVQLTLLYQYNDLGQRTRMIIDQIGTGFVAGAVNYKYNSKGFLIAIKEDVDLDGVTDKETRFEHDAIGRVILALLDENADGNNDLITTTAYDQFGNITNQEIHSVAADVMTPVSAEVNLYDSVGNLEHKALFSGGSDQPDTTQAYEYDANGNLLSQQSFAAEVLFESQTYEYDSADNLTLREVDEDGDGSTDATYVHELANDVDPWWTLFPQSSAEEAVLGGSINTWMLLLLGAVGAARYSRKTDAV